ncbi:hypothetical protein SLEP1_g13552 [Rubroshorea leprosula]|uniref:Uncharacterized protein n=1 Tax=Rubroshorea leprosula TaxID=152421 RepID=A0AAV5IM65_9ROSI|nr:hypothetical protein SLEP1_g13552 [Rubroshorea leprosula]
MVTGWFVVVKRVDKGRGMGHHEEHRSAIKIRNPHIKFKNPPSNSIRLPSSLETAEDLKIVRWILYRRVGPSFLPSLHPKSKLPPI